MSTLSLWAVRDPFAEFDAAMRSFGRPYPRAARFTPAAETERDGDDAIIRLELPGLDIATDVAVELDRGRLVISGERRTERRDGGARTGLREVHYGAFRREFAVPAQVKPESVSASYDAGILTVRIAGMYATASPITITITPSAVTSDGQVAAGAHAEGPDDAHTEPAGDADSARLAE